MRCCPKWGWSKIRFDYCRINCLNSGYYVREWITVAVGTTIADRPPHRSVRARLRTRLLPWMNGGETNIRIGMQNARVGNPPTRWETTAPSAPGRVDCDELKRSATACKRAARR